MAKQMGSWLGSWLPRVERALSLLGQEKPCLSTTVNRPGSLSRRLGQHLPVGPPSRAVGGAVYHGEAQLESCRARSGLGPTGPLRGRDLG